VADDDLLAAAPLEQGGIVLPQAVHGRAVGEVVQAGARHGVVGGVDAGEAGDVHELADLGIGGLAVLHQVAVTQVAT